MRFRARNPYYLRISEKIVLPIYVYLDDRHIDWMSDRVLQHILADLRPRILPKLQAEADVQLGSGGPSLSSKKQAIVDTHRGEFYQFCYFIRKTEPHSVLIKDRHFTLAPPTKRPNPRPKKQQPKPTTAGTKRKGRAPPASKTAPSRKKAKTKGKSVAPLDFESDDGEEESAGSSSSEDDEVQVVDGTFEPRRSKRIKKVPSGAYTEVENEATSSNAVQTEGSENDVEMVPGPSSSAPIIIKDEADDPPIPPPAANTMDVDDESPVQIDIPEEEEDESELKPKPILHLKYQGFSIYGRCLCIVVEPWPPLQSEHTHAPSVAPSAPSRLTPAPSDRMPLVAPSTSTRGKTPLFLPDEEEDARYRSETPAPARRTIPPVPLFNDSRRNDDDELYGGGMMEFSQVLAAVGDERAGAVEDEEETDTANLFVDGES